MTKVTDALNYAQKLKWKQTGHMARLANQRRTNKTTLQCDPRGKSGIRKLDGKMKLKEQPP